jgi:hypothetical protein
MGGVDSMRVATDAMANHGRARRFLVMAASRNLGCVKLSADELTTNFASGPWAEKYPPILTIAQAAEMLQVPVGTLRFWRTSGRLNFAVTRRMLTMSPLAGTKPVKPKPGPCRRQGEGEGEGESGPSRRRRES